MGWFDRFRRRRGRSYTVREGFESLPREAWTDDEYDHWFRHLPEADAWGEWEAWSRRTVLHPAGIRCIRRDCLDMLREAARDTDAEATAAAAAQGRTLREDGGVPGAEFACLLRIEGDTITEPVLIPGTVAGDEHAIFDFWMQPLDRDVRGSIHSHPDEHPYPSDADFGLFESHGEIHLILCRPYGPRDWRAYDFTGTPVHLDVV